MSDKNKTIFKKGYIISKDKDENDLLYAKEYFEEPNEFLKINPKISIGVSPDTRQETIKNNYINTISKIEIEKIPINEKQPQCKTSSRNNNNLNTYSKVIINEPLSKTIDQKITSSLFSLKEKSISKKEKLKLNKLNLKNMIKNKRYNLTLDPKQNNEKIHYQFSTLKDLKKIYEESLERQKNFKFRGTNDLMPARTDSNIKKKYFSQEKTLKFSQTARLNTQKYLKYLAKKCNKNENELLINNIEDFRLKKQLNEYIENNKILAERFGDNYWLFSLRRLDKNDFLRINYVNVGNSNREIWKRFIDYPDKDLELTNNPFNQTKNKNTIQFNFNKNFKNKIKKIPNVYGFNEIKIEGKNLANKEYKDIVEFTENNDIKNFKFKVYKDPRENNKKFVNNFTCREEYKYINKKNKNNKYNISLNKNRINKCLSDKFHINKIQKK